MAETIIETTAQLEQLPVSAVLLDRDDRPVWYDQYAGWSAANGTTGIDPLVLIEDGAPLRVVNTPDRQRRITLPVSDDGHVYVEDLQAVRAHEEALDDNSVHPEDLNRLCVERLLVEYRRHANEHGGRGKTYTARAIMDLLQAPVVDTAEPPRFTSFVITDTQSPSTIARLIHQSVGQLVQRGADADELETTLVFDEYEQLRVLVWDTDRLFPTLYKRATENR